MNKIDKIKSYNQIILAIGSTLLLLFTLTIGIIGLMDIWNDYRNNEVYQDGILASETTTSLLTDSLRKQLISVNSLALVDSASQTYLLPIKQANLKEGESVNDVLGLINTYNGNDYSYLETGAAFNNLVLYESLGNKSKILFNERISINEYRIIQRLTETYLLIIGTNEDSNQDNYINGGDLQSLFIYELKAKQLTKMAAKEKFTTIGIVEPSRTILKVLFP